MLTILAIIALTIIAAFTIALMLVLRRTTIHIVIRKDPDMATIKQRLAANEAAISALTEQLAAQTASGEAMTALSTRVEAIEAEIGTDVEPTAGVQPSVQDQPDANGAGAALAN